MQQLLLAMWRDLPRASNGFANNVMQALSTSGNSGEYRPDLRRIFQRRLREWIARTIEIDRRAADQLARVVLMAFDGIAMTARLSGGVVCTPAMARIVVRLMESATTQGI